MIGDETAEQIVAGLLLLALDQLGDVGEHRAEGLCLLFVGGTHVQPHRRVVVEQLEVVVGHSEQMCDDERRHR